MGGELMETIYKNLYWNNMKVIAFDIETTSLSSPDGEFVCGVFYPVEESHLVIENFDEIISKYSLFFDKDTTLFVTFNGENWRGGFDFPWLRTKFIQENIDWFFKGYQHLDLYPLIKKYTNFDFEEIKPWSKSKLNADKVREIARVNNVEYINKAQTYAKLKEKENTDWLDYSEEKNKGHYDLQTIYQTLSDPNKEETYIDGKDTAKLVENGEKRKVIRHCKNDVKRLHKIASKMLNYIPEWEIDRNINRL